MDTYSDYMYTYSGLFGEEDTGMEDWLERLSPSILEAFNEYTVDKDDKEDY